MLQDKPWQFAIDVGGTFTDCLAISPQGQRFRHKLLSSGATVGIAQEGSSPTRVLDAARRTDPADFWEGYLFRVMDRTGACTGESVIERFDHRRGVLDLCDAVQFIRSGQRYEILTDEHAPLLGIRYLLGLKRDASLPHVEVRLGTTRGTNALLTRSGARTGLLITQGFADILQIRDQQRPNLFDLRIRKPLPIYEHVVEIKERLAADGSIIQPLDEAAVAKQLSELLQRGVESLAICLLHGYAYPQHEITVGGLARACGFQEISLSHQVAPLIKIVPRGDTTVANAYLNPLLKAYVEQLQSSLDQPGQLASQPATLCLMTSTGGLVEAANFQGKDSILSGPAGGVVGFAQAAQAAGFRQAIGFDMGGTSTDVARFGGQYERRQEIEKNGVRIVSPMLAIETVAAGGGSVCDFDGVQLLVGPASAGADPGPACYGKGGPLTITDMNLLLGRVAQDQFPFPLDLHVVESAVGELCEQVRATGTPYQPLELAAGFVRVANANMARAIQSISTAKGYDPREHVLVSFGGAAPQHACAVADELGIRKILNHPDGSILSAVGIAQADILYAQTQGVHLRLNAASQQQAGRQLDSLGKQTAAQVAAAGIPSARIQTTFEVDLRFVGTDAALSLPFQPIDSLADRFLALHLQRFGFANDSQPLEIVALRALSLGKTTQPPAELGSESLPTRQTACPRGQTRLAYAGQLVLTDVYQRTQLRPGHTLTGPAIIAEPLSTTVVDPHWQATVLADEQLLLTRIRPDRNQATSTVSQPSGRYDPVLLEVYSNTFGGIAEQMGLTLQNTSRSVNVKERLDFSCAIFEASGELVVNAPHVPVHLGAMSETIRCLLNDHPPPFPGDVFITNDPYRGGSHLPDVTVITPVFDQGGKRLFFVASRAHHAEIGGIRPGSMPPFSHNLAEEGVLIRSQKVVEEGRSNLAAIRALLSAGPHPSRAVDDNIADITAQIAANQQGVLRLQELVEQRGSELVLSYMRHLQDAAAKKIRLALRQLPDGRYDFADALDDGWPIHVALTVQGDSAEIDFEGTGPVHPENLNANPAIVRSAVIYVLRCLIAKETPLNEGLLRPIRLFIPEGLLHPPDHGSPSRNAAVVGGNVETSQRIVDVLLGALGLAAASQGTMNNLLFGDAHFGYYETLCGGAGATRDQAGAHAVHTHMTNTRLTDPEVLEQRFPVRLRRFEQRRGSGGIGHHSGGDGVVREIEFLQDLEVSIVSQRRTRRPFGLSGGGAGQAGVNTILRADGHQERLEGRAQLTVRCGDVLRIETPGGGGWGAEVTRRT